jgi:hypothetical protein
VTSLAGNFETDLPIYEAVVACTDAIDGLGWHIETVEANRIVSYASSGFSEHPPKIEVELNDSGQGTDIHIVGSDTDANPLQQDQLVALLDRARDAIQASIQETDDASEEGAPAGWFADPHQSGTQRYWDGDQWTERTRSDHEAPRERPPRGEPRAGAATEPQKPANWWREHWRGPVIAIVALLVGAAIGMAGGNSGTTKTVGRTTTATIGGPVTTQTTTQTQVSTETRTVKPPSTSSTSAAPPPASTSNCDPSYTGGCLNPNSPDYDCAGGTGDGPDYVQGPIQVVGDDHYGLDSNGDGVACQ